MFRSFLHKIRPKRRTAASGRRLLTAVVLLCGIFVTGCGTAGPKKQVLIPELSRSFPPGTIISSALGAPVSFEHLIDDLADVRVVYVGETHTNPEHHEVQLKILRALYARHPDLIVGMEMFDRTYQEVLRKWSSGGLDEAEFLQKTHWNANWSYDFSLYRPLLNFIRDRQIPLYGLNIPFHIPPKIAAGGIESLSEYERAQLPEQLDFSSVEHKEFVQKIFDQHPHARQGFDFDNFYAAQVVWEEVMAETISRYLDARVLVAFTGNGHLTHRFGIPERARERTGAPYRTVLPLSAGTTVELSSADYLWVTPAVGSHPPMR